MKSLALIKRWASGCYKTLSPREGRVLSPPGGRGRRHPHRRAPAAPGGGHAPPATAGGAHVFPDTGCSGSQAAILTVASQSVPGPHPGNQDRSRTPGPGADPRTLSKPQLRHGWRSRSEGTLLVRRELCFQTATRSPEPSWPWLALPRRQGHQQKAVPWGQGGERLGERPENQRS